jgi:hypothetical protein
MKICGEDNITSERGDIKIWTRRRKRIVEQRVRPFGNSKNRFNPFRVKNVIRMPLLPTMTVKGNPMLNEQTFDKLYVMKLIGMAEGFKEQLEQSCFRDLSFEERFGMLVERQWSWKENKRLKHLLKEAKLKLQACIEDIDYRTPRGLEKSVILGLASCDWIPPSKPSYLWSHRGRQNLPGLRLCSESLP